MTSGSRRRHVRRWSDALLVGAGIVLLVLSALPVDKASRPATEGDLFRLVNDHTVLPFVVVWTLMQLGNIVAVPIAAVVAIIARKWRLAAGLLFGGVAVYVLAKVVKGEIERGRPASLLDNVEIRGVGALGRGYPSGHAAVVTLMAVLAWPYLGRRGRIAVVLAAVFVCLARMYVGAHLPVDIVGGAALGLAVGGAVRLLLGRPTR